MKNQLPIKAIKLTSGELLVSYVRYHDDMSMVSMLENPVVIQLIQTEEGINMVLRKWIPYSDDQIYDIPKSQIITHCSVNRELEETYILGIKKDQLTRQKLVELEISDFNANIKKEKAQEEFDNLKLDIKKKEWIN